MKIIGQPESYSDMLQRIFWCSVGVGVACTYTLGRNSPALLQFFADSDVKITWLSLEGLKLMQVLIPFAIAIFSRIVLLHDKISDIIGIREYFDMNHIIMPLAAALGVRVNATQRARLRKDRDTVMAGVFYRYAGWKEPTIDKQLVMTALDTWGWFWVLLESSCLCVVTMGFLWYYGAYTAVLVIDLLVLFAIAMMALLWRRCVTAAEREVHAILVDPGRRADIRLFLSNAR